MYELTSTETFDHWINSIKDRTTKRRIANRLLRVEHGNFGDHKNLGEALYELRLFFAGGLRIYYTFQGEQIVLLVSGGDKSSQSKDIQQARELMNQLQED